MDLNQLSPNLSVDHGYGPPLQCSSGHSQKRLTLTRDLFPLLLLILIKIDFALGISVKGVSEDMTLNNNSMRVSVRMVDYIEFQVVGRATLPVYLMAVMGDNAVNMRLFEKDGSLRAQTNGTAYPSSTVMMKEPLLVLIGERNFNTMAKIFYHQLSWNPATGTLMMSERIQLAVVTPYPILSGLSWPQSNTVYFGMEAYNFAIYDTATKELRIAPYTFQTNGTGKLFSLSRLQDLIVVASNSTLLEVVSRATMATVKTFGTQALVRYGVIDNLKDGGYYAICSNNSHILCSWDLNAPSGTNLSDSPQINFGYRISKVINFASFSFLGVLTEQSGDIKIVDKGLFSRVMELQVKSVISEQSLFGGEVYLSSFYVAFCRYYAPYNFQSYQIEFSNCTSSPCVSCLPGFQFDNGKCTKPEPLFTGPPSFYQSYKFVVVIVASSIFLLCIIGCLIRKWCKGRNTTEHTDQDFESLNHENKGPQLEPAPLKEKRVSKKGKKSPKLFETEIPPKDGKLIEGKDRSQLYRDRNQEEDLLKSNAFGGKSTLTNFQ